nr:heavy metal translocating P-type ATPase [Methylobrevis albus]
MDLAVENITCAACIDDIEGGLADLDGIVGARLNLTTHRLAVEWQPGRLDPADILARLQRIGYRAHPFEAGRAEVEEARQSRTLLTALAVAGFAAMNVMLLSVSVWSGNATDITPETRDFFHWISALIALPAAAFAGQPFFRSALAAIRRGRLNMDVPISLGVLLALGLSVVETINHAEHAYFDSAVMLLFFLLLGRTMEHAMRRRTRAVAGNLAALRAPTAQRLDGGSVTVVPTRALVTGDRILVGAGDRIAVDGLIEDGRSEIDESLITGETDRRSVGPGDRVHAGCLNHMGSLTVRVTAADGATLLDEIERLLERAGAVRAGYVRLADRVARAYAPVVHLTALATLAGWLLAGIGLHDAVVIAITVLIITCPCALALAVPAVQVAAAGRLFRAGVLLNAGDALERLATVDTVVFDKTGTLTLPDPQPVNSHEVPADLLAVARRLALSSRHPLARGLQAIGPEAIPYEGVAEQPGAGVSALVDGEMLRLGSLAFCGAEALAPAPRASDGQGDPTASLIAVQKGERRAVLRIHQMLRPDAEETVTRLRRMGLSVQILSGDRSSAVAPIARRLGVEAWRGDLTPAGKIAAIEGLKREGRSVVMVGDGLNDAPALAAAAASLSPVTAVDLAQAAADAVFLGDRLGPVAETIAVGRRARRLMRENLGFALAYNLVAVPVAIAGHATPLVAALAMSGSSLVVTLNALRLSRRPAAAAASSAPRAAAEIRS